MQPIQSSSRTPWRAHRLAIALPIALCMAMAVAAPTAFADERANARHDEAWEAVSNHRLDQLRGGFSLGNGLMVSLGLSRTLYVNGELAVQTTLDFGPLSGLSDLSPVQAMELSRQLASLNLVQIGPGNAAPPASTLPLAGTIIQNTLDNQSIANTTVIHATSNAMGLMKDLNFQSTLADSLNRAIGR